MVIRVTEEKNELTLNDILENKLCTGCGVCISEDRSKTSFMDWDMDGFLVPILSETSTQIPMQKVCPFSFQWKEPTNEDELAKHLFGKDTDVDVEIGHFKKIFAGYSKKYRATSSSGGIATFVFENLLIHKHVEYLFVVRELNGRYAYQLFDDPENIKDMSKTRYYPVTLEKLFVEISQIKGRVAVSGVACFIKAIRLKQYFNPELKEKIPFLIGIICGGLKSRYYTDYLSQSACCYKEFIKSEYRVKKKDSFALDYQYSCTDKESKKIHVVDMQSLGDMWGTGLFKANACDFCDDVTTELADISLGDAWIEPYNVDGAGNSVVVCRSILAVSIIENGIGSGQLHLEPLSLERFKLSQQGSFNHRHKGLLYRIKISEKNNRLFPIKRVRFLTQQPFLSRLIQKQRLLTREKSLEIWRISKNPADFDLKMRKYIKILNTLTFLNRKYSKIKDILSNLLAGKR